MLGSGLVKETLRIFYSVFIGIHKTINQYSKKHYETNYKIEFIDILLVGIPFGLIMMEFDSADGIGFILWKLISITLFFGIAMSITLVSFYRYGLKKIGIQEIKNDNINVN